MRIPTGFGGTGRHPIVGCNGLADNALDIFGSFTVVLGSPVRVCRHTGRSYRDMSFSGQCYQKFNQSEPEQAGRAAAEWCPVDLSRCHDFRN